MELGEMDHKSDLNLAELFKQKEQELTCDVALVATADDSRIPAHRDVLRRASEYFDVLFTADMKEKNLDEIPLDGVSGTVLRQLVDYAYTEQIDIDESNVDDILAAADLFLFGAVVKMCERIYVQTFDATNALSSVAMAGRYRLNDLSHVARTFVSKHFATIAEDGAFLDIEADALAEILDCDDIQITSENDVFNTIVRWIEVDTEQRKQHYAALMRTLRMSEIEYNFLNDQILEWSDQMNMQRVFMDACRAKCRQDEEVTDPPRTPDCKFIYAVGKPSRDGGVIFERYSIMSNTWEVMDTYPAMPSCKIHWFGGRLHMFEGGGLNRMESRKYMRVRRENHASVVIGNYMYFIGGVMNCVISRDVQRYDTRSKEWVDVEMLEQARSKADAAVLAGKIYIVGGDAGIFLRSVERYDPETNLWENVNELNVARSSHRCCVINGYIYAVGGRNRLGLLLSSIEKYDKQLDQWTIIEHELDEPRCRFGIASIGFWIYIAGGKLRNGAVKSVQRINMWDGRIEKLASMCNKLDTVFCQIAPS